MAVTAGFVVVAPAYPLTSRNAPRLAPGDVRNQPADAAFVLAIALRRRRSEVVPAGAGMGVDVADGLVLRDEPREQCRQHRVLQDVGMIAGVVTVQIAQHAVLYCRVETTTTIEP